MTEKTPSHVSVYLAPETYKKLADAAEKQKRPITKQAEVYIERGLQEDGE